MGSRHIIKYSHYSLFYCEKHMCGYVLSGNHDTVPEWHNMCGCGGLCDWTCWIQNGLLTFDGVNVEVIKAPIDFSARDGGGFEFQFHIHEFYYENGSYEIPIESPIHYWFETFSS